MNNLKLNKIIEYIQQQGEFPFDVFDVDEDLQKVLCFFGVYDEFSSDEINILKQNLQKLALNEEFKEAIHITEGQGFLLFPFKNIWGDKNVDFI